MPDLVVHIDADAAGDDVFSSSPFSVFSGGGVFADTLYTDSGSVFALLVYREILYVILAAVPTSIITQLTLQVQLAKSRGGTPL